MYDPLLPGDPEGRIDLIWIDIVFCKYFIHTSYMKYEKIKKNARIKNKFITMTPCVPAYFLRKKFIFFHGAITNHMCKQGVSLITNNSNE